MKKFLTVLLVIAVMFTFSFGSAFAATDAEMAAALANAKAHAEKVVNDYYDAAMKEVVKSNLGYTEATDAEVAAAWALIDAKAQVMEEIAEDYLAEAAADFTKYDPTTAVYAKAVFGVAAGSYDEVTDVKNLIIEVAGYEAVRNMYEADRAEVLSAFDKVDYSVYSATEKNAEGKTYLEVAEKIVADAKEAVADMYTWKLADYSATSAASLSGTSLPQVRAYVANYLEAQKYTGTEYATGLYLVKGVLTADKVEAGKATEAAQIASMKASVAAKAAAYLMDGGNKTFAANFQTVFNYVAEEDVAFVAAVIDSVNVAAYNANDKAIFADAIAAVAEMEAYAAKYAAEKDATGAYVRDAEDVQDEVDAYTEAMYKYVITRTLTGTGVAPDADTYKTTIANLSVEGAAYDLAFAKEVAKAALANALEELELADEFYALEAAKIEAAYAKTLAKIEAADTVAKVEAIDVTKVTLKGTVKDADAVDDQIVWTSGAPKAAVDAVKAYVNYANTGKNVLNADYILVDQDAEIKAAIAEIYGEAGARTAAEIKAVAIDAAAVAAELVTVADLADAKAAAEAAIKALPAKITEADKDAVVAACDLVEDYNDMFGHGTLSNIAKLEAAQTALKTDMVKNFAIAVAKADKKDLASMEALQAAFDAANELVEDGYVAGPEFDDTTVANAIVAIRDAELAAVKKAINNLPINLTDADKAQVEAAREAYDAFVAKWTDYEAPYNAVAKVTNFRELALAEAALGLNAEDAAYTVEALKITAKSTVKKGAITVKWSVEGDDSAVEGYEVYRSVKKNSGFGTKPFFTTTKMTYKNTKNLKAGTRYYFKVRAFATTEEGEKVYSDWSNKAYRVAK